MRWLIFNGVGIGDTVFALATAKGIKNVDKSATIDFIMSDSFNSTETVKAMLKCQESVDKLWIYSKKNVILTIRTIFTIRKKYDYVLAYQAQFVATRLPYYISKLIGAKLITNWLPNSIKKTDFLVKTNKNIHILEQYGSLVREILPDYNIDCQIFNTNILENRIERKKNIITFCIGTNKSSYKIKGKTFYNDIKSWSIDNWLRLSKKLLDDDYLIVLIGGLKERKLLDDRMPDERILDCVGKFGILESIAIVSQSNIVVGADTGLMHCAAAMGKATVSLFGATNPDVWKPYSDKAYVIMGNVECAPCLGKKRSLNCLQKVCMKSICVDDVYEVIIDLLKKMS